MTSDLFPDPKFCCATCGTFEAEWRYTPGRRGAGDYYCDDCVGRGCSCLELEEEDEQGRLLPCCEYDYAAEGWEK
jgi:hypothetical protein